jgi:hypothetical protein
MIHTSDDSDLIRQEIRAVRIVSNGPNTARRLAWRFVESGFETESYELSESFENLAGMFFDHTLLILDLGWSESEVDRSMKFLFAMTAQQRRLKIVALVPRLEPESRPLWSELGVFLALDRTTAPPEIVARVLLYPSI